MKRVLLSSVFICCFLFSNPVANGFDFIKSPPAKEFLDTEFSYPAGDLTYIFGTNGEGLMRVEKNNEIIYDFGNRPAWFMLKYMKQVFWEGELRTQANYYYPQLGSSNNNFLDPDEHPGIEDNPIVNPGLAQGYPEDFPPGVLYLYEMNEPELTNTQGEKTIVGLFFCVLDQEPFDGIMVYLSVHNCGGDKDGKRYRLMEVHCPFVRLPEIGQNSRDDVLTVGNYLLDDPIHNYKPKIEPNEVSGDNYVLESGYYPRGCQVRAYYDTGEQSGRGIYMALYNMQRETGQNNMYKHQGDFIGWTNWIGEEEYGNWPDFNYRDYLLWDIVRYTKDINEDQNDYGLDLFTMGESWSLCSFMTDISTGMLLPKNIAKPMNISIILKKPNYSLQTTL